MSVHHKKRFVKKKLRVQRFIDHEASMGGRLYDVSLHRSSTCPGQTRPVLQRRLTYRAAGRWRFNQPSGRLLERVGFHDLGMRYWHGAHDVLRWPNATARRVFFDGMMHATLSRTYISPRPPDSLLSGRGRQLQRVESAIAKVPTFAQISLEAGLRAGTRCVLQATHSICRARLRSIDSMIDCVREQSLRSCPEKPALECRRE